MSYGYLTAVSFTKYHSHFIAGWLRLYFSVCHRLLKSMTMLKLVVAGVALANLGNPAAEVLGSSGFMSDIHMQPPPAKAAPVLASLAKGTYHGQGLKQQLFSYSPLGFALSSVRNLMAMQG